MGHEYFLPGKAGGHLRRAAIEYGRSGDELRRFIVAEAKFLVIPETDSDNWNGGSTGHTIVLYLPEAFFERVPLSEQSELGRSICSSLNESARSIEREYWAAVHLEMADENDPDYQRASAPSLRVPPSPESMDFWRPGEIRLFISHRDNHKKSANTLAQSLEEYGISCFVAHDTIQATKEWRREIMNGLETMEAMLVFLTDDFAESSFTNQEVGFALGRAIPVVSLKLEVRDPPGFISHEQALRSSLGDVTKSAAAIVALLADKLGRTDRIQTAAVSAFATSPSWSDTTVRFDRMAELVKLLTDAELAIITRAFKANDQLHSATYLTNKYNRLLKFLERTTGRQFELNGRDIGEKRSGDDWPPF